MHWEYEIEFLFARNQSLFGRRKGLFRVVYIIVCVCIEMLILRSKQENRRKSAQYDLADLVRMLRTAAEITHAGRGSVQYKNLKMFGFVKHIATVITLDGYISSRYATKRHTML